MTKDKEVCGLHQHFQEDLIVDSGGGIANAVVIVKGAKGDLKPGDVTFDQKRAATTCRTCSRSRPAAP